MIQYLLFSSSMYCVFFTLYFRCYSFWLLHLPPSWLLPTWILHKQMLLILSSSSLLLCFPTLSSDVFQGLTAFLLSWAPQFYIIWVLHLAAKLNHVTLCMNIPFLLHCMTPHLLSSFTCSTFDPLTIFMSFFLILSIISEPQRSPALSHAGLEVGQVCPLRDVRALSITLQYNTVKVTTCKVQELWV